MIYAARGLIAQQTWYFTECFKSEHRPVLCRSSLIMGVCCNHYWNNDHYWNKYFNSGWELISILTSHRNHKWNSDHYWNTYFNSGRYFNSGCNRGVSILERGLKSIKSQKTSERYIIEFRKLYLIWRGDFLVKIFRSLVEKSFDRSSVLLVCR